MEVKNVFSQRLIDLFYKKNFFQKKRLKIYAVKLQRNITFCEKEVGLEKILTCELNVESSVLPQCGLKSVKSNISG